MWASRLSTRLVSPFTTTAVLKAGFSASLYHIRTCLGAMLSTESFAGSERNKMACALAIAGKSKVKQIASGTAIPKKRWSITHFIIAFIDLDPIVERQYVRECRGRSPLPVGTLTLNSL